MKLLWRYLFKEIGLPFVMWLVFLFLLLLVMQLLRGTDTLLGSAVTLTHFARLIAYLSPHFLVMAVPIAFLLAILLGLGRLMEDRELVALNALGVSPLEVLAVPVLMSVGLGVGLYFLAAAADPWGQALVKRLLSEVVKKNVTGDVKPMKFYADLGNLTLYAEQVDKHTGRWTNVLIHDDRDPRAPLLVLAHEGTADASSPGANLSLKLKTGQVHRAEPSSDDYTIITFDQGLLNVGVKDAILHQDRFRSPRDELTPTELLRAARKAKLNGEDARSFWVALHMRIARLWTPLAFALLAGPLALFRRQGRGTPYFFALFGYVAYYVLSRAFENWGMQGAVPAWLGGAGTNALFAGVGLWLLLRVKRLGAAR